jgi:hypothetical protein
MVVVLREGLSRFARNLSDGVAEHIGYILGHFNLLSPRQRSTHLSAGLTASRAIRTSVHSRLNMRVPGSDGR